MKKFLVLILSLFVVFVLAACGESGAEEKDVNSVETSGKADEVTDTDEGEDEAVEDSESDAEEFDQVIADTDNIKATLVSIEKVTDTTFEEEYYGVNIEIENKQEETLEVQTKEISADGRMIDDMVFFSETVSGGKISDATMKIQNYDGDLPSMEENLEFILSVYSSDDYEVKDEVDVIINFNN
ncbi:hypothetical protein [Amphibacillus cookii]|uniref:hypothetical protein n=1 Tax=Amphibacillus cookii TaxID=767787 RepID=UPI0019597DB3|nr:hypothetical protein [Amphibacillus cookii]MBM7541665.1 ABC-type glycerol-3-phosphate transport system substrate-binding protein [Amphibacillus cookii]